MSRTDGPGRARGRFDDLVYEPDPLGRVGKGRWVRRDDPRAPVADNPDAAVERLRAAWRDGTLDEADSNNPDDPDDLFELDDSVGPRGRNDKLDVAKVETLLAAADAFDLEPTDGPTGNFSDRRADAIRDFQRANRLRVDGLIEPGGETLEKLQFATGAARNDQAKRMAAKSQVGLQPGNGPATAIVGAKSRKQRIDEINRRSREQTRELTRPTREGTRGFQKPIPDDNGPVPAHKLEIIRRRRNRPDAKLEIQRVIKHKGSNPPILRMEESRHWAILNGKNVRFNIADNPRAKSTEPYYAIHDDGAQTVAKHQRTIEQEARAAGVDPELVKAIVYVENAHGKTYGSPAERLGVAETILPMNVNARTWGKPFGFSKEDLEKNPRLNVRVGVALIKKIVDRLDVSDRTAAKIATLYNSLARENVNDYGARVNRVLKERLWLDKKSQ